MEFNEEQYNYACGLLARNRLLTKEQVVQAVTEKFSEEANNLSVCIALDWIEQMDISVYDQESFTKLFNMVEQNQGIAIFVMNLKTTNDEMEIQFSLDHILSKLKSHLDFATDEQIKYLRTT